ncbi:hypothetical protein Taro_053203 [Colocasia esculenta]|uniref:RNase H type-1 domain-containing protein n=1 Tax=Colocasia esculenta TaxID=4460 RepID=A0A843XKA1_COLES|nr:hypothetical protein [Colocasia esculenta]
MAFLNSYEEASEQLVNKHKGSFYVPANATYSHIQKISDTTGFIREKFPVKYLGVSIYAGRQKSTHFANIISQTVNKIQGWKTDLLSSGGRLILIHHILIALPIYTMNAMPIPTTVVRGFHRILANFFWGSYEGSPKRHWKSWSTIAQPREGGGLGVLNLNHMQFAFRTKMLWKALTTDSLWARFFRGKHLYSCHHSEAHFPFMLAADRKLWKQAAHIIQRNHRIVSMNSSPTAYFWYDAWTGEMPLKEFIPEVIWNNMSDKYCTVQQAFNNPMSFQLQTATKYCPRHLLSQFLTSNGTKDTWIWCPTANGKFSTKYVRSLLAPANSQQWAALWSPHIPPKWSVLLWRLILNSIPVDETVKEKGVPLVSKCSCCPQPQEESSLHLFFRSDTADQVWSELSHLLHFSNREVSAVTDGVTAFLARPEIIATSGRLVRCIFMAALWEIWCSRNKARFQDQGMTAKHIINRTMLSIRAICISFKFQKVPQPWLAALHQTEHDMEELKSRTPTIVRWITPPSGRLKLNVDGTFMRTLGTAGGGGILRDHEGNMCWAFARAYHDLNSSLAAEAMALNDGLSICCSKGVSEVLVETDSLNLLQLVTKQISSQWDLTCIMHDIAAKSLNLKAEIAHVPREANRVADCLASSAMSYPRFVIWSS